MDTSILTTIKKLLGLEESYTAFDIDIIININTVFSILTQMGIGPNEGFEVVDNTTKWSDFDEEPLLIRLIKSFIYLKVKMLFDPSENSNLTESNNKLIKELEYRLYVWKDNKLAYEVDYSEK